MSWNQRRRHRRAKNELKPGERSRFLPRLVALEARDVPTAFTPGDIVVVREADNTLNSALGNFPNGGNAPIYLDEYTPAGSLVQTVGLPYSAGVGLAANQAFTFDPSNGTGCGQLSLSFDSSVLTLAANDCSPGTTDAVAKTADRVIGQVAIDPAAAGGINTITHGLFGNTDDARAVVEADPNTIYVVNHANSANLYGGTRYINGLSTTPNNGVQTSQNTNTRGATIGFDGRLYWTTAGPTGVYTQGPALPTTLQIDQLVVANPTGGEKLDGLFLADMNADGVLDAGDRMYYVGLISGLDVSVYNGSSWSTPISLGNAPGTQMIGLAAQVVSPTHVVLDSTTYGGGTVNSLLVRYDDIGSSPTAGAGFTTVLSLPETGSAGYRGVSFVPVTPTVINLISSTAATNPGGSVTFTATLSNTGAGLAGKLVDFIDNNNTVLGTAMIQTDGTATLTTTSLPLGENDVKVYFAGSSTPDVAMGVSNTVTVEVTGTNMSSTSLTSAPNPSTLNKTVTFSVQVQGAVGTPTGTVRFTADGSNVLGTATLDNTGQATLPVSNLTVGMHSVTAFYSGDANYLPSSGSLSMAQKVDPGATIVVTSSAPTTTPGTPITLTATVNGNGIDAAPTGSVTFFSDGTMIGSGAVSLVGNQAQLPISTLTAGSHMITATYGGDTIYAPVTSSQLLQNEKQAFAQGDLLVTRLGDNSTFLSSSAAQVYIDEYTPAGVLVQSVAMPNVDSGATHILTESGSSPNSGTLAVSADGHYVTLVGIDAAPGTPVVTSQSPATTPRVIARLDSDSVLDTSTAVTIPSGEGLGSVVGAVSNDGKEFWVAGDGSTTDAGLQYTTLGKVGTPTPISPNGISGRAAFIFNGQLYMSTGSNSMPISTVGTGLPTSQTTLTDLPGLSVTPSGINDPEQFLLFNHNGTAGAAPDLLYVADLQQGLLKFAFDGTNWNYVGAKRDFAGGLTGLTGYRDPGSGNIVLFGTGSKTSQGAFATNLITFTDSAPFNANFPAGNVTELANVAAKSESFRGIAFVPTPAPITVAGVQANNGTAQRSEVRSLQVTFSGPVTFAGGNVAAAFQLQHVQDSTNIANLQTAVGLNAAGQTVVTLSITTTGNASTDVDPVSALNGAAASLADGRYQLTVFSADVTGTNGLALAGGGTNGNYVSPADTYQGNGLHLYRLFGDVNGDGTVDTTDLGQFRSTYNSNSSQPNYLSYLDADNSGGIDAQDLGQFRSRYNLNVFA